MIVPRLKSYAADYLARNLENSFLKFQTNKLPDELCELVFNVFKRNIDENQNLIFKYGPEFNDYLSKHNISLYDRNFDENLRLELILIGIIKKYINFEVDKNKLLFSASYYGNLQTVEFLKINGADINSYNTFGETPLMLAAMNDYLPVVKFLIKNGAKITSKDNADRTALMYAVDAGNPKMVKYLVKNGADINARDSIGEVAYDENLNRTALGYARDRGYFGIATFLKEKGANY